MLDLERLYQRVIENPDADAPRLAYAAACEASGDTDRALVIRLQIEAVRQERAKRPAWNDFTAAFELLAKDGNAERWAGPIAAQARRCQFHRGFVERIELDASEFIERADDLFRLAPIRRLELRGVAQVLRKLVASPYLARVVSLTLDCEHIGDLGIELLASSPHLQKLAWLSLEINDISRRGLVAMMKSDAFPSLRYVSFYGNPVFGTDIDKEYGDDQGKPIGFRSELWPIEEEFGRKPWLHTVADLGLAYESESVY